MVNIFPNPTDDLLNIGYDQIPPSEVLIYDISGKLVLKTNKHSNIDVSTYAPGVYFVKIIIESQERVGKLIVK
ncbi:T9SS type A sorting domain-containing protein [Xanthomarina gelatinilytica]|uniref:T9SS type A sorting domain-containing protein n=1 Tax=Xanthomarina gelatinilytica TaxID=1137281 RepID=UPI003AA9600E